MKIAIYGTQAMSYSVYRAVKLLMCDSEIMCFLVTSMDNNPRQLDGVPVIELKKFVDGLSDEEKNKVHVLIGTQENNHADIEESLEENGMHNYSRVDSVYRADLLEKYYTRLDNFKPLSIYIPGHTKPFIRLYAARSDKDRVFERIPDNYNDYTYYVHAGKALSDMNMALYLDNSGKNISDKNRNYCELTVLYWVWKNKVAASDGVDLEKCRNQYYGIEHYRRIFNLSDKDLMRLTDNEIDAVLPFPLIYEPDINAHHRKYIKDEDWEVAKDVLQELHPDRFEEYMKVLEQSYLYNCNMILARREVLNDYCEWLFPILECIEERTTPKGCDRHDRYIGYIAETLETMYFMANKDRLKIAHAGYKFLI